MKKQRREPNTIKVQIRHQSLMVTVRGYRVIRSTLITLALIAYTDPSGGTRVEPVPDAHAEHPHHMRAT